MNNNLPSTDYHVNAQKNKEQFMEMMKVAAPELHVVAVNMEKTKANPIILFHIINHMAQIADGTGYGQVHILIEEGVARFVKGEHSTKLNEPVIRDTESI